MKIAACMIVRNEVRDIDEWIAFHALAGFDTQIIFDNGSTDGTAERIHAAARTYDIRFHNWVNRSKQAQTLAYEAACEAYKLEFDWIAFLDSDEFLITAKGESIAAMLEPLEAWSAVALNWAVYGSNGHDEAPPGLVLENFTRRADENFFPARHVKSIVRPRLATGCPNPHFFKMAGNAERRYCDPNGNPMLWMLAPEGPGGVLRGLSRAEPDYTGARINHYFTRSRAHWRAKVNRGYPSDVAVRTMEEFDTYDRNEVEDPIALRHITPLRTAVTRLADSERVEVG